MLSSEGYSLLIHCCKTDAAGELNSIHGHVLIIVKQNSTKNSCSTITVSFISCLATSWLEASCYILAGREWAHYNMIRENDAHYYPTFMPVLL